MRATEPPSFFTVERASTKHMDGCDHPGRIRKNTPTADASPPRVSPGTEPIMTLRRPAAFKPIAMAVLGVVLVVPVVYSFVHYKQLERRGEL